MPHPATEPMRPQEQALFDAIARGDVPAVRTALVRADASTRDHDGVPALVAAARLGQAEIVGILLEAGAELLASVCRPSEVRDVDELDDDFDDRRIASYSEDAFGAAMRLDHESVVERLLAAGVPLDPKSCDYDELPLPKAAAWSGPAVVRKLLAAGARVEHGDPAPLVAAAEEGRADVVQILLDAGAMVDAMDADGATALLSAAESGDLATVQTLLRAEAEIGTWSEGSNVLTNAVVSGNEALFSYLWARVDDDIRRSTSLDELARQQEQLRREADRPIVRLTRAAMYGRLDAVEEAIRAGVVLDTPGSVGLAALHFAVRDNHPSVVDALLAGGANPDVGTDEFHHLDRIGSTPLHVMLWRFYDDDSEPAMIERLTAGGAGPNASTAAGWTPLMVAISHQRSRGAEIDALLDAGADVDRRDIHGNTALMMCVAWDRDVSAQRLRTAGASEQGLSEILLHRAAEHGDIETIQTLVGNRVDVDHIFGCTALGSAAADGHTEVVRVLLAAGADPNLRASSTEPTPLMSASYWGDYEAVCLLLDAGADPRAAHSNQASALDHANSGQSRGLAPQRPWAAIIERLEAAGAPVSS